MRVQRGSSGWRALRRRSGCQDGQKPLSNPPESLDVPCQRSHWIAGPGVENHATAAWSEGAVHLMESSQLLLGRNVVQTVTGNHAIEDIVSKWEACEVSLDEPAS